MLLISNKVPLCLSMAIPPISASRNVNENPFFFPRAFRHGKVACMISGPIPSPKNEVK